MFVVIIIILDRRIARIGDQLFEPCKLLLGDVAVCACLQPSKCDVHDPHTLKGTNAIVKSLAHTAYLAVQTLGKDYLKCTFINLLDSAGAGHGIEYRYTGAHFFKKLGCDLLIYAYDVFLLVIIPCAKDLIDDIAVIGQQNKTFRVLVESSDGEDPFFVTDEIDDIVGITTVGSTDDTLRLIKGNEDKILILGNESAFEGYLLSGLNLAAHQRFFTIDGNKSRFNRCVRLTPGTDAGIGKIFIDPDSVCLIGRSLKHFFFSFHISPICTASLHSMFVSNHDCIIAFPAPACKQRENLWTQPTFFLVSTVAFCYNDS